MGKMTTISPSVTVLEESDQRVGEAVDTVGKLKLRLRLNPGVKWLLDLDTVPLGVFLLVLIRKITRNNANENHL